METLITRVTDGQKKQVKRFTEDALDRVIAEGLLDKDGIQKLIENGDRFQADIMASIRKHSRLGQFINEEAESNYGYLSGYSKPKGIAEQVDILHQLFPSIGNADEKIAEQPLPSNAEGWFAIPRWQLVGKTYEKAFQKALDLIREQRGLENYREGQLGEKYLQQKERTMEMFQKIGEAQKGGDILVVAAQFGLRHKGRSARRACEVFTTNEFGLGAFEIACMILTHQDRLANFNDLWIDCAGNKYAPSDDSNFSDVPFFIHTSYGKILFTTHFLGIKGTSCGSASGFLC